MQLKGLISGRGQGTCKQTAGIVAANNSLQELQRPIQGCGQGLYNNNTP